MPTVVIASPKGGAGKSTTAVLLGTELAHAGAKVVMLDCDPNQSLTLWADRGPLPDRISILSSVGESDIVKTIKRHDTDGQIAPFNSSRKKKKRWTGRFRMLSSSP